MDNDNNYMLITVQGVCYSQPANEAVYTIQAKSGAAENIAGSKGSNYQAHHFDIYDLASGGGKLVALYKADDANEVAELTIIGDKINFTNIKTLPDADTPHSVATNGTDIIVAGVDNNKLKLYYNGILVTDTDIDVKANTKVSAVYTNGAFYAVYTDNAGNIQRIEVANN